MNDSPTDSRRKKSLIRLGHVSEIEDVNFQHVTDTVETLARFFKITTSSNGLERLITQLYKIKEKLDKGWVEILSLKAALIVYSLQKDFTLKYECETLRFSLYANQDILIKGNEKLIIIMDLWLDFERPFIFTNPLESDESICCFYEI